MTYNLERVSTTLKGWEHLLIVICEKESHYLLCVKRNLIPTNEMKPMREMK